MNLLKMLVVFFIIFDQTNAGALIKRSTDTTPSIFDQLWSHFGNFMSETLHMIGSLVPLRGFATMAKDIGIPFAEHALAALTPPTNLNWATNQKTHSSQRRSDTVKNIPHPSQKEQYRSLKVKYSGAIETL